MNSAPPDSPSDRLARLAYRSIYGAALLFLAFKIYQHHHHNYGYTLLPLFSHHWQESSLDSLKKTPHYTFERGYDGQFYAQLALRPSARGLDLEHALDNHPYRARRILFSWTAAAFGFGNPLWTLEVFSFQNAVFWFLSAFLLIRWLPPTHWQNALRFIFCLFTLGLVNSFNRALLDGPSLFLIMLGAYFIESKRSWLGAATLGLAGLGKETNLLSVFALSEKGSVRSFLKPELMLKAALACLPFFAWYVYVLSVGERDYSAGIGGRNFTFPLFAAFQTFLEIIREAGDKGFPQSSFWKLAMLGALVLQGIYLLARPKRELVWSRIGIVFALLMLVLGTPVWEGLQAIPRVLLPMTIAFNILFSRRLVLLPVLIFANSLTFVGINSLEPIFLEERFEMADESKLAYNPETNESSHLQFQDGWSTGEGSQRRYWRWSEGDSVIEFFAPGNRRIEAEFHLIPKTIRARDILFELNGEAIWQTTAEPTYGDFHSIPITLAPGLNTFRFHSPAPPDKIGADPRKLSFALVDYKLRLIRAIPESE